jgi:tetratricopeptide (TPR) repeat protein
MFQKAQGTGNIQISIESSQNITVMVNGQATIELRSPLFPKPLPGKAREIDLMKAAHAVTTVSGGRESMLKEFVQWCSSERKVSIRTLIGPGGAGKTRFAFELYRYLGRQPDWDVFFLNFLRRETKGVNLWDRAKRKNTLFIADYASDFAGQLGDLLPALAYAPPDDRQLRVLLLARTADWSYGWLSTLRSGRMGGELEHLFDPVDPMMLSQLTPAECHKIFGDMLVRLAELLNTIAPSPPPVEAFESEEVKVRLADPLTLMMAASAAAHSGNANALVLSRSELALNIAKNVVADRMRGAVPDHNSLFLHMAAYATLCGGMSREEILQALAAESTATGLGQVADPELFVNALQGWLPGESTWIGKIEPDIVGEAFLLGDRSASFLSDADAVIMRAAKRKPSVVINMLVRTAQDFSLSADHREEPLRWLEQLIKAGVAKDNAELLFDLHLAMPKSTTVLRGSALHICEELFPRLQDVLTQSPEKEYSTASLLTPLLITLTALQVNSGYWIEAVANARTAVAASRGLVARREDGSLPLLAISLGNLSAIQAKLGQRNDALANGLEAVEIERELVRQDRIQYLPDLAVAILNLSVMRRESGDTDDALAYALEATKICDELVRLDPEKYRSLLATSINHLSVSQLAMDQRNEALANAMKYVELCHDMIQRNRDATLPDLARALMNLSVVQGEMDQKDNALANAEKAVDIEHEIAEFNSVFLPDLANSLKNLASRQHELGQRDEALANAKKAVEIWRKLVRITRPAFIQDLATSLNLVAILQSETGKGILAIATAEEGVHLVQQLLDLDRPAFLPDAAGSFQNLTRFLMEGDDSDRALAKAREAVDLWRELAQQNQDKYLPDLGMSLNVLAGLQKGIDALATWEEAIVIWGTLCKSDLTGLGVHFSRALSSYGSRLVALNRLPEAAHYLAESLRTILPYVAADPGRFLQVGRIIRSNYLFVLNTANLAPDAILMQEGERILG